MDIELLKTIVVGLIAANIINRVAINPLLNLVLGRGVQTRVVHKFQESSSKSLSSSD